MVYMIIQGIQILTSLFLIFAFCFFAYGVLKRDQQKSTALGNFVSAFFMLSALLFVWR